VAALQYEDLLPGASEIRRVHQAIVAPSDDDGIVLRIRGRNSPDDLEPFIEAEFLIRSYNRDPLAQRLSDDLAVERVAVVRGQREEPAGVTSRVGQHSQLQIIDGREDILLGQVQFSLGLLDRNLRQRDRADLNHSACGLQCCQGAA